MHPPVRTRLHTRIFSNGRRPRPARCGAAVRVSRLRSGSGAGWTPSWRPERIAGPVPLAVTGAPVTVVLEKVVAAGSEPPPGRAGMPGVDRSALRHWRTDPRQSGPNSAAGRRGWIRRTACPSPSARRRAGATCRPGSPDVPRCSDRRSTQSSPQAADRPVRRFLSAPRQRTARPGDALLNRAGVTPAQR